MTRPIVPDRDGLQAAGDRVGPVAERLGHPHHPPGGVGVHQAAGRRVQGAGRRGRVHPRRVGDVAEGGSRHAPDPRCVAGRGGARRRARAASGPGPAAPATPSGTASRAATPKTTPYRPASARPAAGHRGRGAAGEQRAGEERHHRGPGCGQHLGGPGLQRGVHRAQASPSSTADDDGGRRLLAEREQRPPATRPRRRAAISRAGGQRRDSRPTARRAERTPRRRRRPVTPPASSAPTPVLSTAGGQQRQHAEQHHALGEREQQHQRVARDRRHGPQRLEQPGRRAASGSGSERSATTSSSAATPVTTNAARQVTACGEHPGADRGHRGADGDPDHQPGDLALPPLGRHGVAEVDQAVGEGRAEEGARQRRG